MSRPNDLENWVEDDSSSKIQEPITAKKQAGFIDKERIPFQFLNWLFNRVTKWINHFDDGLNHFAPSESTPANMTVSINKGRLFNNVNLTNIAEQISSTISAPVTNPRIDRVAVNVNTGLIEIIEGVEAGTPTAPNYSSNHNPICQILLSVSQTEIVNEDITDERSIRSLSDTQLKTRYESNSDTNAFTDAEKTYLASLGDLASLDSVSASQIDANAVGASEIATGAVAQAEIAASAVGQAELKTSSGTVTDASSTAGQNLTLPGGQYGFWVEVYNNGSGSSVNANIATLLDSGSYVTNIFLDNNTITGPVAVARQRYITASPPYNLGDGLVGLFIFALVDNTTGDILSAYSATEAPWHYNGPTNIIGKINKDGKRIQMRKDMASHPRTFAQARLNPLHMAEYAKAFAEAEVTEQEITQKIKQADMNLIPHPFTCNDLTGKTVVMLDPVSDLNYELLEIVNAHDEFNLNELLHEGHLKISNQGLQRSGPEGILIPSFKWKNSK